MLISDSKTEVRNHDLRDLVCNSTSRLQISNGKQRRTSIQKEEEKTHNYFF